jgi:hypothetical protein
MIASILAYSFAPLMALQGAGQTVVAVPNDSPETWTVEYPQLIQPFVEDYRRCLIGANRKITGQPDFEIQHRSDVPRCTAVSQEAQAGANSQLAGRGEYADFAHADVDEIFQHLGRIHIARGADLDNQFSQRMQASAQARTDYDERPRGLVLELRDASVVKARTDAAAAAQPAMEDNNAQN